MLKGRSISYYVWNIHDLHVTVDSQWFTNRLAGGKIYISGWRSVLFLFTENGLFFYFDIHFNVIFLHSPCNDVHCSNCWFAQIRRKKSEVPAIICTKMFWKGVSKDVIKDEIMDNDTGDVIKVRAFVNIRGVKTLYCIPSM